MFQLKFNKDFNKIVKDLEIWQSSEDISNDIKEFIKEKSAERFFYEKQSKKFFCGKCLKELNSDNYCATCDQKFSKYFAKDLEKNHINLMTITKMPKKTYELNTSYDYYAFNLNEKKEIYLYHITEEVIYDNPFTRSPYKTSKLQLNLNRSYYLEKSGLTNLETNKYHSFKDLENYQEKNHNIDIEIEDFAHYIYVDNLEELKETIYQYTNIWEVYKIYQNKGFISLSELTMFPLYYPSYEYLIKYKLYNLALNTTNYFKKGHNFKEIFGIDKKYLHFMIKHNISITELEVMKEYPTEDYEVINFFKDYIWDIKTLTRNNIDLKKLKEYLEKNNLTSHLIEYLDYIRTAKTLKLDLKDKKILYPQNLLEAHNELFSAIEIIKDPDIDYKIKKMSSVLNLNRYEDANYVIYPVSSIAELVEESRQQKNCVRSYSEKIAKNESQIYFMRKKTEITKSLVTIEVRDQKIIQARVKYNELPSQELRDILSIWESTLIPIQNN